MSVSELIDALKRLPPDAQVTVETPYYCDKWRGLVIESVDVERGKVVIATKD